MTEPSAGQQLLAGLDPEQRLVAEALRGPVRVLAGAGTGKTRAITHRIAHGVATGVYAPAEVLAVTFTTRAAGELRARLRDLGAPGVQARTFHSAALRQLRYFLPRARGREVPTLIESKIGLIAQAARRTRLVVDQAILRDLAAEIEWAKVSNAGPEGYARLARRRGRAVSGVEDPQQVAAVFAAYEEVKTQQGRMDMEDVLLLTAGLLAEDERVAAEVRRQYKWFVVDEFQDVSPLQAALLDLWLGGRHEICVVGDPAQTIYSFAGAQDRYLLDFPARHPDTFSVELVRNYRSTPEILTVANGILAGSATRAVRLSAQRPAGAPLRLSGHSDDHAEAEAVARAVGELHAAGTPYRELAVLVRVNAQTEPFEEAFTALGIPYTVRGAGRFFDRAEVKEAIARLRGAARSGAPESDTLARTVRDVLAAMGWTDNPPATRGQARDRWESLQALIDQAAGSAATDLSGFVAELDRRAGEQHAPVPDGVTVATLHAAKGLEWDVVFVCGLQEGTVPFVYARSPAEIEEERRLLYVGVTRARTELWLSHSAARRPGGRGHRQRSRFLDHLHDAESSSAGAPARKRTRTAARCRVCGGVLASGPERKLGRCSQCPANYDEAVFERLRAWRKARATADSVPAFVVFTDATLQLLAEHRPDTAAGLLTITGIGPAKVERYGAEVLAEIAAEDLAEESR